MLRGPHRREGVDRTSIAWSFRGSMRLTVRWRSCASRHLQRHPRPCLPCGIASYLKRPRFSATTHHLFLHFPLIYLLITQLPELTLIQAQCPERTLTQLSLTPSIVNFHFFFVLSVIFITHPFQIYLASPFNLVFRETQSLPPLSLPGVNLAESPPSSPISSSGFRDRLNTALERLRSPSPLVPGLEDAPPGLTAEEEEDMQDAGELHLTDERPPVLPPIQTTENVFHATDTEMPSPVHTQSSSTTRTNRASPANPPVLPPIPVIGSDIDVSTSTSARQNGAPNASVTLGNHPLPSPVLRDLHSWSWMEEERQSPPSPNTRTTIVHQGTNDYTRVRGAVSLDSRSTAAADTGTEATARDTATFTATPFAASAPSSTWPEVPLLLPQERLARILERLRAGAGGRTGEDWDWGGQMHSSNNSHRSWLSGSHAAAPWASSSAETDILRHLLPGYSSNAAALPSSLSSSSPSSASRSVSTTPALAPVYPPLSPGDSTGLDSYWEPVFTNLPEARLPRVVSQSVDMTTPTTTAGRHWYSPRRPHGDDAGRTESNTFGQCSSIFRSFR